MKMNIGQKIRKLREQKNLTQEYVATKLSMSIANYSKIERNEIPLTVNRLNDLATLFEVHMTEIFTSDEKKQSIKKTDIIDSADLSRLLEDITNRLSKIESLLQLKNTDFTN